MDTDSMKPLLGKMVIEALRRSIARCLPPETMPERRQEILYDPYCATKEEWNSLDWMALAQSMNVILFGSGGWRVGDIYGPNATPRQIVEACFERPDEDPLGGLKMDLGLK